MNTKTARLIRRYAQVEGRKYRPTKKAWNSVPTDKRHAFKNEMRAKIGQMA